MILPFALYIFFFQFFSFSWPSLLCLVYYFIVNVKEILDWIVMTSIYELWMSTNEWPVILWSIQKTWSPLSHDTVHGLFTSGLVSTWVFIVLTPFTRPKDDNWLKISIRFSEDDPSIKYSRTRRRTYEEECIV